MFHFMKQTKKTINDLIQKTYVVNFNLFHFLEGFPLVKDNKNNMDNQKNFSVTTGTSKLFLD